MEADWEFEVGGDAPIIEAHWPGFVDLREHPHQARELTEARQLPGLADALARLNAPSSPVWTSKTDVFDPGSLDTDELDATREEAKHAIACYIDLLMRSDQQWSCPATGGAVLQGLVRGPAGYTAPVLSSRSSGSPGADRSWSGMIWGRQHISPRAEGRTVMQGLASQSAWRPSPLRL